MRGAFEFKDKCSAAGRVYRRQPLARDQEKLLAEVGTLGGHAGRPDELVGAVISRRSFDKIEGYIEYAATARYRNPLRWRMR